MKIFSLGVFLFVISLSTQAEDIASDSQIEWSFVKLKGHKEAQFRDSFGAQLQVVGSSGKLEALNSERHLEIKELVRSHIEDRATGTWIIDSTSIRGLNGGRGPGGGDGLFCGKSESHPFEGWYSYDFIQSRTSLTKPLENDLSFNHELNCSGVMNKVADRLKVVNPLLATGLEHFLNSSPFRKQDQVPSIKREWKALKFGDDAEKTCLLFDVQDESQNITLEKCQKCQLFIRKYSQSESKIYYLYHEAQLEKLKERPRQCSYAVIHEWARDFLPDSQDLYDFVSYLHSKEFFTAKEFKYVGLTDDPKKRIFIEQGNALQSTSLELYFKMVSQVPAAPVEVKEFQEKFLSQFQEVVLKIEAELLILEKVSKKDSLIPNDLHLTGREWLEDIRYRVRTRQVTLGKAFQELIELQSSIPIMKGGADPLKNPFIRQMMLNPNRGDDSVIYPWNKFHKVE